tara:strand:- start:449 stop:1537 length:1089 start_codon:yes stop_codon:yes gene_type:complete
MNNILIRYILNNFIKSFLVVLIIIFCFGIILNLFEEIEFFKNMNVSILKPLILTAIFVPSLVIKLLPFIIFISSMWFMYKIRNNNDLLILKIYGFSNLKIFFIIATASFILGFIILTIVSPVTSSMVKYYEKTKSQYARDIDHLVTFNKNGLWIKEPTKGGSRIISATSITGQILKDASIFEFNNEHELNRKIFSKNIDISSQTWVLKDVLIFKLSEGVFKKTYLEKYRINSEHNYQKIISLFSNSDTISFIDFIINYQKLLNKGYSKQFLDQNYHSMLSLPFFLFLMTGLAAILTMHTQKKDDNIKFVVLGLILSVLIYYFKDLSLALGKTDRIPLILSVWAPVIALSLFTFIGVLQINEK